MATTRPEPRWRTVPATGDYGSPGPRPRGDLDLAAHLRTAEVDGVRLHHLDLDLDLASDGRSGTDPVFLLVHGLGGRWEHWSENVPELAEHGRVVAIDLPGFGRSGKPRSGYSVDGFADVVAGLVRQLGLPPVVVVGHSLGGLVAVRVAHRHPDLVDRVVLAGGTVQAFADVLGLRHPARQLRRRPLTVAATLFEVLTAGLPVPAPVRRLIVRLPLLRRLLLWPYLLRPADLPARSVALLVDGVGTPGVLPTVCAIARLPVGRWLADVPCPLLAVGADRDHVAPPSQLAALAEARPSAEAVMFEGAGHMLMLERAAAFNAEVVAFAAGAPRTTS